MTRTRTWAIALVTLLALSHATLAWLSVRGKSSTFDETLHISGAYAVGIMNDYRLNPEDPVLFQRVLALGLRPGDLNIDTTDPAWLDCFSHLQNRWDFCSRALYGTTPLVDGGPGQIALNRARAVMSLVSAGVCGLVGWWAWRLAKGGAIGLLSATIAAALYAFDPNFIGHAGLAKNDVIITFCFVLAMIGLSDCMSRVTPKGLIFLLTATSLALLVKFSGVLLTLTVIGGLGLRAVIKTSWIAFGVTLATRWKRVAAAAPLALAISIVGWVAIWAGYGFRYSVSPDPAVHVSIEWEKGYEQWIRGQRAEQSQDDVTGLPMIVDDAAFTSPREGDNASPGTVVRFADWAMQKHFLPETWLKGFTYTYLSAQLRDGYLMGTVRKFGFPTYFFWAAMFKSPLGLMFGTVAAAIIWWRLPMFSPNERWIRWSIGLIAGVYLLMAVRGGLNLGLRHVLPLYPAAMVFVGVMIARAWSVRPNIGRWLGGIAVSAVLAESAFAFPNGLAFFNAPSQLAGPITLLADSNLDWGQDLPQLAEWQNAHPDRTLSLAYFGSARPEAFGIRFNPLPGTSYTRVPSTRPSKRPSGVWAISASFLCGLYNPIVGPDGPVPYWRFVRGRPPIARLGGGSIWLYDMDAR